MEVHVLIIKNDDNVTVNKMPDVTSALYHASDMQDAGWKTAVVTLNIDFDAGNAEVLMARCP